MVLTSSHIQDFLDNGDQMGILCDTILQLHNKGITTITDLADFYKDIIRHIADKLRCPSGSISGPN